MKLHAIFTRGALMSIAFCVTAPVLSVAANAAQVPSGQIMSVLKWRNVGPWIGGRVVAIAGVPGQPNLFYMGAVDGGVWKSADYGLTWENISDGWPSASDSIGALAVAPSDSKTIYAGTGEPDIRGDMITGDGVFKTTDGGKTWTFAGLADTHTIGALVVDPKNADVVYAASLGHVFVAGPHRGVFKTTDGGKTWHKVLYVNDETGVVSLAMNQKAPETLYAAAWQAYRKPWKLASGGPGSGMYKTTDGGAHWTNITDRPGLPQGVLGKIGVAVAASDPNVVYAAIQAKEGGVFRSDDAGKTWKRMNDEGKLRQRAFYYMGIVVDPKDANTVYMPQVDALFVSHDGGKTFEKLNAPHGDNHVVWINPDNTGILLEGNDGGATVSTDGGKTWSSVHNQPTGQFYHVGLDNRFPFHLYGAQQDEGSFEGPSASPDGEIPLSAWHSVAYGESTWVVPQPGSPNITYGSGYYSIFVQYDLATGQYRSVSPWPNYRDGAAASELKYRFAWTHPILFSPTDPKELLVGSQYAMKSDDYGLTWKTISPDLTRDAAATEGPTGGPVDIDQSGAEIYPSISALAVSPLDGDTIWAGSSDGLVHVTTDGGEHWREVRPPSLPAWARVDAIEPSHFAGGTAYLAARRYMWDDFHPYVFKTADYGRHWKNIAAGLPDDQYVFDIRQDPKDAKLLFLGAKNTAYVSLDGGDRWQALTLNLPHVQVRGIAINNREGEVAIATHGRAFWVLDNLALLEQLTQHPTVTANGATLFAPQQAWLTYAYGNPDYPDAGKGAGKNPPFGATVFFHIPADYAGKTPVTLAFADADGRTVRSFDLHPKQKSKSSEKQNESGMTPAEKKAAAERKHTAIEPGMNRFQWDLRYPDATAVKGFRAPAAAGGLAIGTEGPMIVPGGYRVTLDYGGGKSEQSFNLTLDPRLHATQADLQARFALETKIHAALDALDKALNDAIATRDKLKAAVAGGKLTGAQAAKPLAALDDAIGDLVQMNIRSSEGDLLHETKLHGHLAYLATSVGMAWVHPTAAQYAVFTQLHRAAQAGEQKLHAAIAGADSTL